jgi:uncharacterized protein (TIGR00369 family)
MNDFGSTRTNEQIGREIAAVLAAPIHRHLGLRLIEAGAGRSRLEFTAGRATQMDEAGGRVHGGILALLLEPAALIAALALLPSGKMAVTADMHVAVMRPAPPDGLVELRGRVIRPGTALFFCEAEAWAQGKLIASARFTKAVIDVD